MTRRRPFLANFGRVTVSALAGLLVLCKFFFNRHSFRIRRLLAVFVTGRARRNGHIRRQSPQRARARYVDVASRAFHDVPAFAPCVRELCRDTLRS